MSKPRYNDSSSCGNSSKSTFSFITSEAGRAGGTREAVKAEGPGETGLAREAERCRGDGSAHVDDQLHSLINFLVFLGKTWLLV